MNYEFTKNALYMLAEYAGIDRIEGVIKADVDIDKGKLELTSKGFIDIHGNLKEDLVFCVETLKRYCSVDKYFAFQEYFFAIEKNKTCIILRYHDKTDVYSFYISDLVGLLKIVIKHPRIKKDVVNLINASYPEEKMEVENEKKSYLIMELMDNKGRVLKSRHLCYENGKYYKLNMDMTLGQEYPEENYLNWILGCIPEIDEKVEEAIKGEIHNE